METNNKLIAEFLGYIDNWCSEEGFLIDPKTNYDVCIDSLQFHTDWNWLMQVVEKIESLGYWTELLGGCHQEFRIGKINQIKEFINKDGSDKKEAVYNACIEFIKWYNENKSHL